MSDYKIILASNSPRRKELLKGLDLNFEIKTKKGVDETFPCELKGGEIPLFLAELKSDAYQEEWSEENTMVITADTIVWLEMQRSSEGTTTGKGMMLGKPKDRDEAISMLHLLSGKTHQVYTGVCIRTKEKKVSFVSESNVRFSKLTDDEILNYVDHYKPFDKAGSYGVQEWIGYVAVENIEGSFYNIMGLPVHQLYKVLKSSFSSYIRPNRNFQGL